MAHPAGVLAAPVDHFTELFDASDNDLDFLTVTFTPDGSSPEFYSACLTPAVGFPVDPARGTPLQLADEGSLRVTLSGGANVSLYGVSHGTLFIGDNGYITLGSSDTDFNESIADHFSVPRVAGLFDDLDPLAGGRISWQQLNDRAVVTWSHVPEFGALNSNSFQIEMFFDGRIRITWLGIDAQDGLAGLSAGLGTPPGFIESDLSAYAACDDHFTERFTLLENDLDNLTITFTPDGSADFYETCLESAAGFPTDPAGGMALALGNDESQPVALSGGSMVSLYGTSFSSFFVGSNGFITFGSGDTQANESLTAHFGLPRVSGLFDDLDPSSGGGVSWRQLADRAAVTWESVPQASQADSNTFQIEMFFDGRIRITWLGVDAVDGLAGLSEGLGVPADFTESDISGYPGCDRLTELFDAADNDLDSLSVVFVPDGSPQFYDVCVYPNAAYPVDPSGGALLALGNDDSVEVTLTGGAAVPLYGTPHQSFFVGSNGHVTFISSDTNGNETVAGHFAAPRIAGLFDDLDPTTGGAVSWEQRADRAVVTWDSIPQLGQADSNSFQIEMFFDGRIRLTWLAIDATDGLAGLSRGLGAPTGFIETDLTTLPSCGAPPPCPALETLYGAAHDGSDDRSDLYVIDPLLGQGIFVGPIGFERVGAIAFNPEGTLFGVGERADGSDTSVLIAIDPCTGQGTEIGPTGLEGLGLGSAVSDISVRSVDGSLFALVPSSGARTLVTLDTATGAAAVVGSTGFPFTSGNGMAFAPGGSLHSVASDSLRTLDQSTGSATVTLPLAFSFPANNFPRLNGMDFRPSTGTAYGSVRDDDGENFLATVNTVTGQVDLVGPTILKLDALAFHPHTDIELSLSDNPDPTPAGGPLSYTVSVFNRGPSHVPQVDAVNTLPSGVTFQTATATLGSFEVGTGNWTVGPMAAPPSAANGGFETGDFSGWNAVTLAAPGSQELLGYRVTTGGGTGFFSDGVPAEGAFFAQNGFDGSAGVTYDLYQEINVPADATRLDLMWSERIAWDLVSFCGGCSASREYAVTVQPSGGGAPLTTLFEFGLAPLTSGDTGYVPHVIDLLTAVPGIAGSTVRLNWHQFIPESLTGPAQFELDAVSLIAETSSSAGTLVIDLVVDGPTLGIITDVASASGTVLEADLANNVATEETLIVPAVAPIIDPIPDHFTLVGTPYTGPTPTLSQGTVILTWTLEAGPVGMTIDSTTGILSWPDPTPVGSQHPVTIRVSNVAGFDDESWLLDVVPPSVPPELSSWIYFGVTGAGGVLGTDFPGDTQATGVQAADDDGDGSTVDLVLDIGATDGGSGPLSGVHGGDSFHWFQSPGGLVPFVDGDTYRLRWAVSSSLAGAAGADLRTRYLYGFVGAMGNGNQVASGRVAPPGPGTVYTQIFDELDVGTANDDLGGFEENDIQLSFEQIDLLALTEGDLELDSLAIERFDRSVITAAVAIEFSVSDFSSDVDEVVGAALASNTVSVTRSAGSAVISAPTDNGGPGLTVYGDNAVTLTEGGVGVLPFTPSATSGRIYRAVFGVDSSGNTGALPTLTMRLQTFSAALGSPLYTSETQVNSARSGGGPGAVNPVYQGPNTYAGYLALPSGLNLDGTDPDGIGPLLGVGDQITASVQLQDPDSVFGGSVTVTELTVTSFPEGLLP